MRSRRSGTPGRLLGPDRPTADTVFFGGGTPTLLPSADLVAILGGIDDTFGLAADVEVTTEANPDSVTPGSLAELRAGGFNRISFGMQSSVPHVLRVLERTHDPARVAQAVAWAREAGFEQVSLDLIYGTPGESLADWRASLEAALACEPDHVSAYSLIVEEGTRLARQVRTGVVPAPEDDDLADKYVVADEMLAGAGPGVVRGLQLGPRRCLALPPQRAVLDERELVGDRAGRALPRRGGALVERQAPQRLRRAGGGG